MNAAAIAVLHARQVSASLEFRNATDNLLSIRNRIVLLRGNEDTALYLWALASVALDNANYAELEASLI